MVAHTCNPRAGGDGAQRQIPRGSLTGQPSLFGQCEPVSHKTRQMVTGEQNLRVSPVSTPTHTPMHLRLPAHVKLYECTHIHVHIKLKGGMGKKEERKQANLGGYRSLRVTQQKFSLCNPYFHHALAICLG